MLFVPHLRRSFVLAGFFSLAPPPPTTPCGPSTLHCSLTHTLRFLTRRASPGQSVPFLQTGTGGPLPTLAVGNPAHPFGRATRAWPPGESDGDALLPLSPTSLPPRHPPFDCPRVHVGRVFGLGSTASALALPIPPTHTLSPSAARARHPVPTAVAH